MEGDENWKEYIRRVRELNEEAKMINLGIEETELITLITDGLPPKYHDIARKLESTKDATMNDLEYAFEKEEDRASTWRYNDANRLFVQDPKRANTKPIDIANARVTSEQNLEETSETKVRYVDAKPTRERAWFTPDERANKDKEEEWVIDSAAASHMTSNKNWIKDINPDTRSIRVASKDHVYANGKETVTEDNMPIVLKDILYVPQLDEHLLSVNKLVEDTPSKRKDHS
ncbi:uncharacterized protein [Centruroides vittatus]|uniref:uncharacterized protein n=1 Tax=Centruroides vittatus TaxID=120091 RepID=UPI00350EAFED